MLPAARLRQVSRAAATVTSSCYTPGQQAAHTLTLLLDPEKMRNRGPTGAAPAIAGAAPGSDANVSCHPGTSSTARPGTTPGLALRTNEAAAAG